MFNIIAPTLAPQNLTGNETTDDTYPHLHVRPQCRKDYTSCP